MMAQVVLTADTKPAEVRCHIYPDEGPPIGTVEIDGLRVQSYDPVRLANLGTAFLRAAKLLDDAIAEAEA